MSVGERVVPEFGDLPGYFETRRAARDAETGSR
jgi:hypothetical protein